MAINPAKEPGSRQLGGEGHPDFSTRGTAAVQTQVRWLRQEPTQGQPLQQHFSSTAHTGHYSSSRKLTCSKGGNSLSCSDSGCLGLARGSRQVEGAKVPSLLVIFSKWCAPVPFPFLDKSGGVCSPGIFTSRTFTDFPLISIPFISCTAIFALLFFVKARDAYLKHRAEDQGSLLMTKSSLSREN